MAKQERKNFCSSFKVFKCAAQNDELRPAMNSVYFQNGYVYATDAHMLVRAKITDISNFTDEEVALLEGKSIHAKLLKSVYSHNFVEVKADGFHASDEKQGWEIVYLFNDEKTAPTPPNFEVILSKSEHAELDKIGLKANLLSKLTSAIGCGDNTRLDFTGRSSQIKVSEIGNVLDIKGIIMPMMID